MDKQALIKFEKETGIFFPFSKFAFIEQLEKCVQENIIGAYAVARKESEELGGESVEYIKYIEDLNIKVGQEKINAKARNLDQLMALPPSCPASLPDNESIHNKVAALTKELTEKNAFQYLLQQEIENFKNIEPVLNQTEKLMQALKILPSAEMPQDALNLAIGEIETIGNSDEKWKLTF